MPKQFYFTGLLREANPPTLSFCSASQAKCKWFNAGFLFAMLVAAI